VGEEKTKWALSSTKEGGYGTDLGGKREDWNNNHSIPNQRATFLFYNDQREKKTFKGKRESGKKEEGGRKTRDPTVDYLLGTTGERRKLDEVCLLSCPNE